MATLRDKYHNRFDESMPDQLGEVLMWIKNFNFFNEEEERQWGVHHQFANDGGYCYYFAMMLKTAFMRGELYVAVPTLEVVWKDTNDMYFDNQGPFRPNYRNAKYMIPMKYFGAFEENFKHLPNPKVAGATEVDLDQIVAAYLEDQKNGKS